jgi:hypothetical protein
LEGYGAPEPSNLFGFERAGGLLFAKDVPRNGHEDVRAARGTVRLHGHAVALQGGANGVGHEADDVEVLPHGSKYGFYFAHFTCADEALERVNKQNCWRFLFKEEYEKNPMFNSRKVVRAKEVCDVACVLCETLSIFG